MRTEAPGAIPQTGFDYPCNSLHRRQRRGSLWNLRIDLKLEEYVEITLVIHPPYHVDEMHGVR